MTVNRTTLLDLPLPVTGTESGTWGDTTNNGLTQYLDIAIAGTLVLSTDADVTLTSTEGDSSATNIGATTAQYAILRWTATGSTTRNITALAQSKTYVVINATGGTQSIVLRGAGPTTGVTIISGEKAHCVWNGSDFVKVSSSAAAGGSNTQVQYNSSGVLAGSSNLTFDGTSLTLGGNPTLSAGTANGVLYLNGSKVATSGSALTFDGNADLSFGGSSAASYNQLNVNNTASNGYSRLLFNIGAAGANGVGAIKYAPGIFFAIGTDSDSSSTPMTFNLNGSEQMRLTSTGLGIGTSSPSSFSGYTTVSVNNATNGGIYNILVNGTETARLQAYSGIFNVAAKGASTNLTFETNGSERMRLDSSGNLGLGVTPSAWGASVKAIQIGSYSNIYDISGNTSFGNNFYYNGTNSLYLNSTQASIYQQSSGQHRWYTAPSGTAGNAISFTQALTLDASGNLLLGGTSAGASSAASLAIFNGTAPTGSVTNGIILYAEDVSSSSELKVRDEAGNVTTLSPHNFSLIPDGPSEDMAWAYYSEKGGKRINVDMLKLARMVEKLTGEKLVYES
jgi:hypothetical protein